jgi:hypothetical protein
MPITLVANALTLLQFQSVYLSYETAIELKPINNYSTQIFVLILTITFLCYFLPLLHKMDNSTDLVFLIVAMIVARFP